MTVPEPRTARQAPVLPIATECRHGARFAKARPRGGRPELCPRSGGSLCCSETSRPASALAVTALGLLGVWYLLVCRDAAAVPAPRVLWGEHAGRRGLRGSGLGCVSMSGARGKTVPGPVCAHTKEVCQMGQLG